MKRLLAGEEAAFLELVRTHHGRLIRLALTFVADRSVAEEVVQETWLGVLNGLRSFEGRSSLKTWICRILANRAKSRAVREGRMISFASLAESDGEDEPAVEPERFTSAGRWSQPPESWSGDTPEKLVLREETRAVLDEAIAELPPIQRAVLTLRDVEGVDSASICNVLEITETNQRVLLHRARSRLRRKLERYLKKV
ncbi:MAG: sigma-70 family RNA polymerase sigma factor [Acidobacteriota bacterium]